MFIKILLLSIEIHNNIKNISKLNIYKIIIYWVAYFQLGGGCPEP